MCSVTHFHDRASILIQTEFRVQLLLRGNLILRDGTYQSRAARRRGKLNDIYKVYIIISEILMILVQISLRNGLRSALTLSKLKKNSRGACPQTPLVGAASPLRWLRQRYSVCTPFSKYLATPLHTAVILSAQ